MIDVRWPVMLNVNGEVQDLDGRVLLGVRNFFMRDDAKELGEEVVRLLNGRFYKAGEEEVESGGTLGKVSENGDKVDVVLKKRGRGRPRKAAQ